MAKILELQRKDKHNKERTVGSIEIKNQTETTADLCFFGDINSESLGEWQKYYPEDKAPKDVQDFLDQHKEVSKIYKNFLDLFLICHIIKMLNY